MTDTAADTQPWWKYGYLWLVLSGPLVVVVAACVTGWIAIRNPDPVLAEDYYRKGLEINRSLQKAATLAPAEQARNHAQTGGAPAPLRRN
jgi:hypothetical protein